MIVTKAKVMFFKEIKERLLKNWRFTALEKKIKKLLAKNLMNFSIKNSNYESKIHEIAILTSFKNSNLFIYLNLELLRETFLD